MVEPIFDYQFRLILIGDSTVGKSSLLKYFTDGKFAELSDPTVGVDFFARLIKVEDGTRIKLQLWDTAGQERFRSITKSYYRNSVGALLVYDVCNRASFEHIPQWMMDARRHIEPHCPVFALVGCKLDLVTNGGRREVSKEEARAFADQHGVHHIETSAKTGVNVEEAFRTVTQEVYNRIQTGEYKVEDGWDGIKTGYSRPGGLDFNLVEAEPAKSSCC
ncbi:Ras-related protein Rab-39B [Habropoda laboriosa]|uniref:Ras-related protein Rab-39B n=1 Tax=Habropoda laboriosa TaxID=597456 RepID=A0A0L7RC67_9HYME|nr:PREDICTED: ras-related protein Rab-39B [Habropoda laboriosa]XP_017799085.1 PREDICTED: ras-related protein Rab-39B [Habropoda laboriosa]XP_017799086.1 PREDICTED: ras-related protein Rab-39B [Habropoda laboriosa]KOC68385.1 Ras-related protein Rab-39B [Habropoda laboriosa]